jgi:hypothetical protein
MTCCVLCCVHCLLLCCALLSQSWCVGRTPLVVPSRPGGSSVNTSLVLHPRAVWEGRAVIADFLRRMERQDAGWRNRIFALMQEMGEVQRTLTLQTLGRERSEESNASPRPTFVAEYQMNGPWLPPPYPDPRYRRPHTPLLSCSLLVLSTHPPFPLPCPLCVCRYIRYQTKVPPH